MVSAAVKARLCRRGYGRLCSALTSAPGMRMLLHTCQRTKGIPCCTWLTMFKCSQVLSGRTLSAGGMSEGKGLTCQYAVDRLIC